MLSNRNTPVAAGHFHQSLAVQAAARHSSASSFRQSLAALFSSLLYKLSIGDSTAAAIHQQPVKARFEQRLLLNKLANEIANSQPGQANELRLLAARI